MKRLYFDYASTTPTDTNVVDAMLPYFNVKFGNAASPHSFGLEAQKALEDSREVLAKFLGASRSEIIFTSGGTEANNLALIGIARLKSKGDHIIVSKVEHPSVLETAEFLESEGYKVTYLDVDAAGQVSVESVKQALTDKTILISIMHASNEIGTLQPVTNIGKLAKERGITFHIDAVQTTGHLPFSISDLNADLLSLSAHKFYGPKGTGALYVRKGVKLGPHLFGGNQEQGLRASTQNVAGAVGLAKAVEICKEKMADEQKIQTRFRDQIIDSVLKNIAGSRLNGHSSERLPNNAHFSFEKIKGEALLLSLDMAGIAASMGSACKAGSLEPSHVLTAIGLSKDLAFGALRISIGRWTTQEDVDTLLEQLPKCVKKLRT